jgi:hypothetical protein
VLACAAETSVRNPVAEVGEDGSVSSFERSDSKSALATTPGGAGGGPALPTFEDTITEEGRAFLGTERWTLKREYKTDYAMLPPILPCTLGKTELGFTTGELWMRRKVGPCKINMLSHRRVTVVPWTSLVSFSVVVGDRSLASLLRVSLYLLLVGAACGAPAFFVATEAALSDFIAISLAVFAVLFVLWLTVWSLRRDAWLQGRLARVPEVDVMGGHVPVEDAEAVLQDVWSFMLQARGERHPKDMDPNEAPRSMYKKDTKCCFCVPEGAHKISLWGPIVQIKKVQGLFGLTCLSGRVFEGVRVQDVAWVRTGWSAVPWYRVVSTTAALAVFIAVAARFQLDGGIIAGISIAVFLYILLQFFLGDYFVALGVKDHYAGAPPLECRIPGVEAADLLAQIVNAKVGYDVGDEKPLRVISGRDENNNLVKLEVFPSYVRCTNSSTDSRIVQMLCGRCLTNTVYAQTTLDSLYVDAIVDGGFTVLGIAVLALIISIVAFIVGASAEDAGAGAITIGGILIAVAVLLALYWFFVRKAYVIVGSSSPEAFSGMPSSQTGFLVRFRVAGQRPEDTVQELALILRVARRRAVERLQAFRGAVLPDGRPIDMNCFVRKVDDEGDVFYANVLTGKSLPLLPADGRLLLDAGAGAAAAAAPLTRRAEP